MSDPATPGLWVPDYFSSQLPPAGTDTGADDTGAGDSAPGGSLLDTVVDGDPAACRSTARLLDRSAAALDELTEALTTAARTPTHVFSGQAGDAYRTRAAALGEQATVARDRARALAGGLDALAAGLEAAGAAMSRARAVALSTLVIGPHAVVRPSADAPAAQWRVWRRTCALAAQARALEEAAQSAWRAVLDAVPETSEPTTPGPGDPGDPGDERGPGRPGRPAAGAHQAPLPAAGSDAAGAATASPIGPSAGPSAGPPAGPPAGSPAGSPAGPSTGPSAGAAVQPVLTAQPFAGDSQHGVLITGVAGAGEPCPPTGPGTPAPPIDRCLDLDALVEGVGDAW